MLKQTLLFLLFTPLALFTQTKDSSNYKEISGFIKFNNEPLSYVSVILNDNENSTYTNPDGFYKIKAKINDSLSFTHIGFKEIKYLVEDITSTVNLQMHKLDVNSSLDINKSLKLGGSNIGSVVNSLKAYNISKEKLDESSLSLTEAILKQVHFFHSIKNKFGEDIIYEKGRELDGSVIWKIDGYDYDIPIPIYISEVKTLSILKGLRKKTVINVITTIDYSKIKDLNYNNFYFSKEDFYKNDAIKYEDLEFKKPDFFSDYKKLKKKEEILAVYKKHLKVLENKDEYYETLINFLEINEESKIALSTILDDYREIAIGNPEVLKNIAYKYQELGYYQKAVDVYRKIVNLRPNYSQSYRDLANAYADLKNYSQFWFMYNHYLKKNGELQNNDIGDIIRSEIRNSNRFYEKKNEIKTKVKSPDKLERDVRLVFEWNNSDSEFNIEFVNPEKEVFKLENTFSHNNDLMNDRKKEGYTSKEILIEDLRPGNWLVNFTYLGNTSYKPTILKTTTYYNWGKENQRKKIDFFYFKVKNRKVQLLKINRRQL